MLHDICPAIEPLGSFKGFRKELYLLDTIQAKGTVSLTQAAVANQVPVPFPSYNAIRFDLAVGDLVGMGDPGEAETNGLHLLLQIDSYSNGTESAEWGDRGSLYFLIRNNDLQAGRFERCEFEMQCG